MRFAPQDVAFVADPYPVYEKLRASAPVTYDAATEDELVGTCLLLLNAGHEATVNATLIAGGHCSATPTSCSGCGPRLASNRGGGAAAVRHTAAAVRAVGPRTVPADGAGRGATMEPSYIVRGLDGLRVRLG